MSPKVGFLRLQKPTIPKRYQRRSRHQGPIEPTKKERVFPMIRDLPHPPLLPRIILPAVYTVEARRLVGRMRFESGGCWKFIFPSQRSESLQTKFADDRYEGDDTVRNHNCQRNPENPTTGAIRHVPNGARSPTA